MKPLQRKSSSVASRSLRRRRSSKPSKATAKPKETPEKESQGEALSSSEPAPQKDTSFAFKSAERRGRQEGDFAQSMKHKEKCYPRAMRFTQACIVYCCAAASKHSRSIVLHVFATIAKNSKPFGWISCAQTRHMLSLNGRSEGARRREEADVDLRSRKDVLEGN